MIDQPKIIAQSIQQLQYIWEKKNLMPKWNGHCGIDYIFLILLDKTSIQRECVYLKRFFFSSSKISICICYCDKNIFKLIN
jgi:hypothetical protein